MQRAPPMTADNLKGICRKLYEIDDVKSLEDRILGVMGVSCISMLHDFVQAHWKVYF
jgi:hypothetical protein